MNHERKAARAALDRHDFQAAADVLARYLRQHPDDLEAQLEWSLAHYLNGNQQPLIDFYRRRADSFAACPPRQPVLASLWTLCLELIGRWKQAAAIAAVATLPLAATGCAKNTGNLQLHEGPPPAPSVEVAPPADTSSYPLAFPEDEGPDEPPPVVVGPGDEPPEVEVEPSEPDPVADAGVPLPIVRPKYGVKLPKYGVHRPPYYRYGVMRPINLQPNTKP